MDSGPYCHPHYITFQSYLESYHPCIKIHSTFWNCCAILEYAPNADDSVLVGVAPTYPGLECLFFYMP